MKFRNLLLFTITLLLVLVSANEITPELITAFKVDREGESYKVYALRLPESIDFAGEKTPLDAPDIQERLDKELLVNTYWQSNMMLLLKRANKYFPLIEEILEEEGIPSDFKYLAVIESGLENVRSPKGAKGFWQLMPATAKEYGLEVNTNVDERYHIEKATRVACKYLKKAKNRFGSWTLAAASYNRGMYGTNRLLDRQLVDSYYDLLLNSETGRYVFRILAVKEIMTNPERYGFVFNSEDLYNPIPVKKIGLDTAIANLAEFAKEKEINYKILKIHNPWLIENHLNNKSRKYYEISIPEAGHY
ncbi:lytic transglycosylase domain-containing protein [Flavobacteriaceae bacterium]|jgi:membrane-bound lytic murein transglycosylase D|nr:lytic transglycosylase domain-containing protein [Flavobacteriaceae bacterium]MDA7765328.1 lytic transglycosylase domain-containing protein [Flavobacteriaceae bacterium]MDA7820850.1 lytic transglycosylase domain-containing protein [Flavobacteriaceae bacterium]MDA9144806.1 lytic transglycosylase domain-containing protein [Flavobacteriaceae bacterium]MDA9157341.1 lytic transglycosylase domain-containing protein [Flavobacteriaceae bacterium]|tara:strand:+ start:15532 stop:16446 length:915 start_codon:yes stop_codon:yes gene_type:complete